MSSAKKWCKRFLFWLFGTQLYRANAAFGIMCKGSYVKKRGKLIILICFITAVVITGIWVVRTIRLQYPVSRDSQIMKQLESDEIAPEFVLQGKYYLLPSPMDAFLDDGWEIRMIYGRKMEQGYRKSVISDEQMLMPGECVDAVIRWKESSDQLNVQVANLSEESSKITEGQVIRVEMDSTWKSFDPVNRNGANRFVIKYGINLRTSGQQVKEMLKSLPGFQQEKEEYLLSEFEQIGIKIDGVEVYSIQLRQGSEMNMFSVSSNDVKRVRYKRTDQ